MYCEICTLDKPPQAFKWFENNNGELFMEYFSSQCCEECHEHELESSFLTNCIHESWLETWGPFVSPPPSPEQVKEELEIVFSVNFKDDGTTFWIGAYKQQVMAWATNKDCSQCHLSAIKEMLASFRARQNMRAIGYAHAFHKLATRIDDYMK
tara:strand:+ start:775 stop:1233 length:459 start_codon:yes stop_codon:yes gene_type:complete